MPVLLRSEVNPQPVTLARLKETANALLASKALSNYELSILLVDDDRMMGLNSTYRGVDKTTNVLSFPIAEAMVDDPSSPLPKMLGDIVISLDTAAREAAENGFVLEDYLTILLVHGFVHLLGYDHERGEEDALIMTNQEKELLKKLNDGNTLSPLSGG